MTPRTIAGIVSMAYGVAVLALGATNHPAALFAGLLLLGVFVAVDGWQTRRDQRREDAEQVQRICARQRSAGPVGDRSSPTCPTGPGHTQ